MTQHRVPSADPGGVRPALDEAPICRFHSRAVVIVGMGFATIAYDLFIVVVVSSLIAEQWHLSPAQTGLLNSVSLIAAFLGAIVFRPVAGLVGRTRLYGIGPVLMAVGAVLSAFSPNLTWLVVWRFLLGIGIGGDYRVSAVLINQYANRRNRGKMVGLMFSAQAAGAAAGYIVGLMLLSAGMGQEMAWRLLLGLGAIPAACVIWLRRHLPESSHYLEHRIGHRRAQILGFLGMGAALVLIGIPGMTAIVVPSLLLLGVSCFFAGFGPNTRLCIPESTQRSLDDMCDDACVVAEAERILQASAIAARYSNT